MSRPDNPVPEWILCRCQWGAFFRAVILLCLTLGTSAVYAELGVATGSHAGSLGPKVNLVPEWSYTLSPDETFEDAADALLAKGISSSQLARHNRIGNPAVLKGGDRIRIPMHWLKRQPEPATITAASGQGHVRLAGNSRAQPMQSEMRLRVGDELATQQGTATIKLGDGSMIWVEPNSRLVFNRLTQYGRTGMVDTRLRLFKGRVSTDVEPMVEDGSRFEIATPSAVAAVRGTRFSLASDGGNSLLRVTEGLVAFGPPGNLRQIPAGFSASVDSPSSRGVDIRRLPPVPETSALAPSLARLPATLTWKANGAPAHQLEVFDLATGQNVLSRQTRDSSITLAQLDNGRYRVELAAVTRSGIAGMPAVQEVDVDLEARAAKLVSPAAGESLDDDMPEFTWRYLGENEVGRLEISPKDDFGNLVATSEWASDTSALPSRPLSPGEYYWRVVTEAGGNSVATSEPRKMLVNGTLPPARIININYIDSQVRIFWESVATADDYLLQLSEDPGFQNIVKEATVADTTAALRLIPGRRYFVRLKALSEGPLASRWGPGRELFIE